MAGIATFTTPLEDPYITRHVNSDEEEDKEDFEIKPDDNLVVVAKINKVYFIRLFTCGGTFTKI